MTTHARTVRSSPLALTVLALLMHEPQHAYGLQRLIRQWGKDLVVNVGQRTSLYRTIERLANAGLVAVRGTRRDHAYPEKTVYEITGSGRAVAREWLAEMLAEPKQEFPQFPAALSHLLMLPPAEAAALLRQRLDTLTAQTTDLEAKLTAQREAGLDRVGLVELEYLHAVTRAEVTWLRGVVDDLDAGLLTWRSA
ncbi:PadR family transcriptional regulator [Streptomyces sp. NPDC058301]|uniref:PadR family transcriptional regulator n=1 Tax=Streptomyces sp. NPDC058301 TaxID=3346436 RepID=UPI0036E3385E